MQRACGFGPKARSTGGTASYLPAASGEPTHRGTCRGPKPNGDDPASAAYAGGGARRGRLLGPDVAAEMEKSRLSAGVIAGRDERQRCRVPARLYQVQASASTGQA